MAKKKSASKKAGFSFNDWKAELRDLARRKVGLELDEVSGIDDDLMRESFENEDSPKEFFTEHVVPAGDDHSGGGSDFDPRYEL